jgi:hypothetical protein
MKKGDVSFIQENVWAEDFGSPGPAPAGDETHSHFITLPFQDFPPRFGALNEKIQSIPISFWSVLRLT